MKRSISRALALLLSVLMLIACMTACKEKLPEDGNYITVNGKIIEVPYAIKMDGTEVPMEIYRYYFLLTKTNYFDYGDESYWTQHPEDEEQLKAFTLNQCKYNLSSILLAESYGITLTDEDQTLIDQQMEKARANFDSEEAFEQALTEQALTESLYRTLMEQTYVQQALMDYLFDEGGPEALPDEDAYIAENYVHAQHILIKDKDTAQKVLDRVRAGEDFVTLMKEYGEDPGASEEGYTFTYNQMVKSFEEATFALKENEISGLVESDYGYHIIKRLPLDASYIEENKTQLISTYESNRLSELLEEYMADKEIEYSKYYDQFGIDTIVASASETTSSVATTNTQSTESAAAGEDAASAAE